MSASVRTIGKTAISIRREILSMAWSIQSKDDLMSLISPSIMPTRVERPDGSSSSLTIIEKFIEALIPFDAVGEAKKKRDAW